MVDLVRKHYVGCSNICYDSSYQLKHFEILLYEHRVYLYFKLESLVDFLVVFLLPSSTIFLKPANLLTHFFNGHKVFCLYMCMNQLSVRERDIFKLICQLLSEATYSFFNGYNNGCPCFLLHTANIVIMICCRLLIDLCK